MAQAATGVGGADQRPLNEGPGGRLGRGEDRRATAPRTFLAAVTPTLDPERTVSAKPLLVAATLVVAVGGWYFFRPERAFLDARVSEAAPGDSATVLLRGEFASREHQGRGRAEVLDLRDGRRILRFTEFETLNGPDLQVYLLGSADAAGGGDLEAHGFLSLGALKGNAGDQNYAIPADADLSKYRAVSVWCRRFGVNFTTAPLAPPAT